MVALVMPTGEYDVLVRGTRDKPPTGWETVDRSWIADEPTNVPMPGLRVLGVPEDEGPLSPLPESVRPDLRPGPERLPGVLREAQSVLDDYYFEDRWDERVRHEAELDYYMTTPAGHTYPGPDAVLEAHIRRPRPRVARVPAPRVDGFVAVRLPGGRTLNVQRRPLVLVEARALCPDFMLHARFGDANSGAEGEPASVSYIEALEICAVAEDELGVPARLLTVAEYQALTRGSSPSLNSEPLEWLMPEDPAHRLHYDEFTFLGHRGDAKLVDGELRVRWRRTRAGEPLVVRLCHD